jgi:hypothetical protein
MISDFKGENLNFMKSREVDGINMVIKVGKHKILEEKHDVCLHKTF